MAEFWRTRVPMPWVMVLLIGYHLLMFSARSRPEVVRPELPDPVPVASAASRPFGQSSRNNVEIYNLSAGDGAKRISRYFTVEEFACRDGSPVVRISPDLVFALEILRSSLGAPIEITSGYRTWAHHVKVYQEKGSLSAPTESLHLYGLAADIKVEGKSPKEVADLAERLGFGGVGRYGSFTHVDVWGQNRRW